MPETPRTGRPLLLSGLLAVLVALPGCTTTRHGASRPYPDYARVEGSGANARYTLCHKGRNTLTLPAPAVDAHLRHGDDFGACGLDNRH